MHELGKNYDVEHREKVERTIIETLLGNFQHEECSKVINSHRLQVTDFRKVIYQEIYKCYLECLSRDIVPTVTAIAQFRSDKYRVNNSAEFMNEIIVISSGYPRPHTLNSEIFFLKQFLLMDFWNNQADDISKGNWNGRDVIVVGDNIVTEYNILMGRMVDGVKELQGNEDNYQSELLKKIQLKEEGKSATASTTIADLDDFIEGYYPGELIILAGRPGMGKTTIALISAWESYKLGNNVLFFSLEMPANQIKSKIISLETGIDYHRIKKGELTYDEYAKVVEVDNYIKNSGFQIIGKTKYIEDISKKCKELVTKHDIKIIFVDYLQRCRTYVTNETRQSITEISRELKSIAVENYTAVVALAQLSRAVEQRSNKRPQLSDLKESGSIEEDADLVIFLYREAYYIGQNASMAINNNEINHTEMIIAKGRDTGTKTIHINMDPVKMIIRPYSMNY